MYVVTCVVTVHEAVDSAASAARIQKLEQEKQALQAQVQQMEQGICNTLRVRGALCILCT